MSNNPDIIIKSFKYDSNKHPKIHAWFQTLEAAGQDYAEPLRRLIEGDVQERDHFREQMQKDIQSLKQMLSRIMSSGFSVAAGGGGNIAGSNNLSLSPEQLDGVLQIEEVVAAIEEQPEIKSGRERVKK